MKERIRRAKLSKVNKERLDHINEIIEEYNEQGLTLTLRQLYYQLVSRDVIPNKQSEYSKLSTLLKEGRMGGIVDWEAIEDRLRVPSKPSSWDTPKDILNSALYSYAKPRMKGQDNYIEVWVEKDALSGVLKRITESYHIHILVNRGYSSVSAMYDSYKRFSSAINRNQKVYILYLGDFDPSGVDMIRDIRDRIKEFLLQDESIFDRWYSHPDRNQLIHKIIDEQGVDAQTAEDAAQESWIEEFVNEQFSVRPIALTKEQIQQYKPPPNPAKLQDPRAKKFVDRNGSQSWEVDALKPEVLNSILDSNIRDLIDFDKYKDIVESEQEDKDKIKSLIKSFE